MFLTMERGHPETHTKRQATQHGSLPSLLGGRYKGNEIVYGEEKNILYWADKSSQDKNLLYWQDKPNEPSKDGPLSFILFEFPFTFSVTSQQGLPLFNLSGGINRWIPLHIFLPIFIFIFK
jgi:hypothetical protein